MGLCELRIALLFLFLIKKDIRRMRSTATKEVTELGSYVSKISCYIIETPFKTMMWLLTDYY